MTNSRGTSPPVLNCPRLPIWNSNGGQELSIINWRSGRGGPPWLAVRHREVDVGHTVRGAPTQSQRHPERSPEPVEVRSEPARHTCTNGAGGGSAYVNQILRPWEARLRMTESHGSSPPIWECGMRIANCGLEHGNSPARYAVWSTPPVWHERARESISLWRGDPPWLAVRHREVDVGRARYGPNALVGRTVSSTIGLGPPDCQAMGSSPPRLSGPPGSEAGRKRMRKRSPRCRSRGVASTTRSCTSDAEHEFSRTRSPGRYPMRSFRDAGSPQLLLMRPSLFSRREVCDNRTREAFS